MMVHFISNIQSSLQEWLVVYKIKIYTILDRKHIPLLIKFVLSDNLSNDRY